MEELNSRRMSMLILFGSRYLSKELGQHQRVCRDCGHRTFHSYTQRQLWLTLFFIPVIPLGSKSQYAHCHWCGVATREQPRSIAPASLPSSPQPGRLKSSASQSANFRPATSEMFF
jgi:hypothetical protein